MELVGQKTFPLRFQLCGGIGHAPCEGGCGRQHLPGAQGVLGPAVSLLDGGLGGVGSAVTGQVQFTAVDGQMASAPLSQIVLRGHPVEPGRALQILLAPDLLHFIPGGAAASVPVPEGHIEIPASVRVQAADPAPVHRGRIHLGFVGHMQVAGNGAPVQSAPQESVVRERLGIVVGPEDLLGGKPGHAEAPDDLRQGSCVPEGVRQPGHPAVHAEHLTEITPSVQELADEGFAAGQIGIRLYPHAAVGDPASLGNGGFDFLKQVRVMLPAQFIFGALALEEDGLRVFP